ncbi:MAG TPA: FAD-dependent oxidoreductase [Myxococcales bacterium]|nr:FAD-dependent oxidoreductase [Myxococcales bacterium]
MREVAIAGGGLIGLASALELAREGFKVRVYEPRKPGQASWAAAGILGPQSEVHNPSPMLDLCRASFALYPDFVKPLGDVGFRQNGTLHLAFSDEEASELEHRARWQAQAGLRVERRNRREWFFPDEGQVDNRKLLAALEKAARSAGVAFIEAPAGSPDVICAGSWSGAPVFPVKGEIIALDARPPRQVVFGGGGYVVPRGDLTLIGATAEETGFDPVPTAKGRAYLLGVAAKHGYQNASVVDHWAGLRPATRDRLPLLGRTTGGVILASGHFRNGVLLAPVTARIVAALMSGKSAPVDLAPFRPDR